VSSARDCLAEFMLRNAEGGFADRMEVVEQEDGDILLISLQTDGLLSLSRFGDHPGNVALDGLREAEALHRVCGEFLDRARRQADDFAAEIRAIEARAAHAASG
jgi:hypothetical protein